MGNSVQSLSKVRRKAVRRRWSRGHHQTDEHEADDLSPARLVTLASAVRQGPGGLQRLSAPEQRQAIQAMQRMSGNAAVQRMLAAPGPAPVQRQPAQEPLLRVGSASPSVVTLQQLLIGAGAKVAADGIFGPATGKAVAAFQKAAGLAADGIVGPKTWGALKPGGVSLPAVQSARPASKGIPPHLMVKLETLKATMRGMSTGGAATGLAAPEANPAERGLKQQQPAIRLGIFDDISDWAEEKVDAASEWVEEKTDAATDWVEEKVSDASDWVEEKVDAGAEWVEEKADAASDWVEEQIDDAGGWVEEKVDAAVQEVTEDLKSMGDGLRERFPEQMAILDKIVNDLGQGFGPGINLGDLERRMDGLLDDLTANAGVAADESNTCTPGETKIDQKTNTIRVNGGTVQDAIEAANQMQGGHVASVQPVFDPYDFCPPAADNKPVQSAKVKITEIKTIPDWRQKNDFPAALQMWNDYIAAVIAHEDKHLAIDAKHFTDMHKKAEAKPPKTVAAATAAIEKVKAAADKENEALDAKEGCIKLNGGTGAVSLHPRNAC